MFVILLQAIWFILPAYIANAMPLIVMRFWRWSRHPMDFGVQFIDGRRVLGPNKTWEGFSIGVLGGVFVGLIQGIFSGYIALYTLRGFVLGLGAMLGDALGAFIKRRLGIEPGKPAPIIDQLSFVIIAIALAYVSGLYTLNAIQTLFIVFLTLVLHPLTNAIAYIMKIKSVPW